MRKAIIGAVFAAIIGAVLVLPGAANAAGGGFNQFGYNYGAGLQRPRFRLVPRSGGYRGLPRRVFQ